MFYDVLFYSFVPFHGTVDCRGLYSIKIYKSHPSCSALLKREKKHVITITAWEILIPSIFFFFFWQDTSIPRLNSWHAPSWQTLSTDEQTCLQIDLEASTFNMCLSVLVCAEVGGLQTRYRVSWLHLRPAKALEGVPARITTSNEKY